MEQVSVVVRTRDKEQHLNCTLKMLLEQTLRPSEIILVNNYSSKARLASFEDNLKEQAESFKNKSIAVRVVNFPDRDFSHAFSTNLGMFYAKNEFVVATNAHALPTSCTWLAGGVRHFRDGNVACVTGYSYPLEKNSSLSKLSQYVYHFSERVILRFNWTSTVNCIIRRSLWRAYPFDENLPKIIPETKAYGCEDYDWSKEMEARGFKIVVDPQFSVFHSHERRLKEAKRNIRNYVVQRTIQQAINRFKRPRKAFTRLGQSNELNDVHVLEF